MIEALRPRVHPPPSPSPPFSQEMARRERPGNCSTPPPALNTSVSGLLFNYHYQSLHFFPLSSSLQASGIIIPGNDSNKYLRNLLSAEFTTEELATSSLTGRGNEKQRLCEEKVRKIIGKFRYLVLDLLVANPFFLSFQLMSIQGSQPWIWPL